VGAVATGAVGRSPRELGGQLFPGGRGLCVREEGIASKSGAVLCFFLSAKLQREPVMAKKLGKNAKLDRILAELSALRADVKKILEPKGAAAKRSTKGGVAKKAAPRSASRKAVQAPSQAEDDEAEKKPPLQVAAPAPSGPRGVPPVRARG
jgi:type II secretory pathway component PulM